MAVSALAANSDRESKGEGRILEFAVAKEVDEFYKGAILMADSSGFGIVGADTASCLFLGIIVEHVSITTEDTTDGDTKVRAFTVGDFLFGHNTGDAAITSHGTIMCIANDNAVDDLGALTNDIECGVITQWKDADEVWVRIDDYSCGKVLVAAA